MSWRVVSVVITTCMVDPPLLRAVRHPLYRATHASPLYTAVIHAFRPPYRP